MLAVISDWKVPVISGASVVSYTTVVVSSQDYSPFGVTLEGRSWSVGYRYGFQNQETDDELWGGAISFKYRVEDARLGRFFSVDPLFYTYPSNGTYNFAENKVIWAIELEGLEACFTNNGKQLSDVEATEALKANGIDYDPNSKDVYLLDYDFKSKKTSNFLKLDITIDQMHSFASNVWGEGHGTWNKINYKETYAIANACMNYLKAAQDKYPDMKYTINDLLIDPDFMRAPDNSPPAINSGEGMVAYGAVINALVHSQTGGWIDYSNGSIQWEGQELASKASDHYKANYNGILWTEEDKKNFKSVYPNYKKLENSFKTKSLTWKASAGDHKGKMLLKSNGVIGTTVFFKSNDNEGKDDNVSKFKTK